MQAKAKKQSKHYKAAVIGCGMIGGGLDKPESHYMILTHANGYVKHDDCSLVACVDNDPLMIEQFRQKWGQDIHGYQDLQEMLAIEQPEIISICTPTQHHATAIKTIYQYPSVLAVICEKPLTYNIEELLEIENIIKNSTKVFLVNYIRSFDPAHQEAIQIAKSGEFGAALGFHGIFSKGLYHNGSHLLALIEDLFGKIVQFDFVHGEQVKGDLYGTYFAKTASGVTGTLFNTSGEGYAIFELDILFATGRIEFYWFGRKISVSVAKKSQDYEGFNELETIYFVTDTLRHYGLNTINYAISLLKTTKKRKALIDRQIDFSKRILQFKERV